ncbi:hypothetical protein C0991_003624, partial [Blastosporella zonata]
NIAVGSVANGGVFCVEGVGKIKKVVKFDGREIELTLDNVLHALHLDHNLISIRCLDQKGCTITFGGGTATFYGPGRMPFMHGTRHNHTMYKIDFIPRTTTTELEATTITAMPAQSNATPPPAGDNLILEATNMPSETAPVETVITATQTPEIAPDITTNAQTTCGTIPSIAAKEAQTPEDIYEMQMSGGEKVESRKGTEKRDNLRSLADLVDKATHGTVDACRNGWKTLDDEMTGVGYTRLRTKQSVQFRKVGDEIETVIGATYTDNTTGLSSTATSAMLAKKELGGWHKIKDPRKLKHILEICVECDKLNDTLTLSQDRHEIKDPRKLKHILEICVKCDRLNDTLMLLQDRHPKTVLELEPLNMMQCPPNYTITHDTYSDPDYTACLDQRCSAPGFAIIQTGGLTLWSSKSLLTLTTRTTKAEPTGMAHVAEKPMWTCTSLTEIKFSQAKPSSNLAYTSRDSTHVKRINARHHCIPKTRRGRRHTYHAHWHPQCQNIANLFTKPLPRQAHHTLHLPKSTESGFGWDDEKKIVTADANVWEALIKSHPPLKKWQKASFPLFDEMANLIEGTYATSGGVFQPGRDFTPKTDGSVSNSKDNIDPILRTSSTHSVGSTSQISNIITPANTTPPTPSAPALTSTAATSSLCKHNADDDEPTSGKTKLTGSQPPI